VLRAVSAVYAESFRCVRESFLSRPKFLLCLLLCFFLNEIRFVEQHLHEECLLAFLLLGRQFSWRKPVLLPTEVENAHRRAAIFFLISRLLV